MTGQAADEPSDADAPNTDTCILETFEEEYRESLQALPKELFPQSTKHGKHSYTVQHGCKQPMMITKCSDLIPLVHTRFPIL